MMVLPSTKLLLTILFFITVLGNAGSKSVTKVSDKALSKESDPKDEKPDKADKETTHEAKKGGSEEKVNGGGSPSQETSSTGFTASTSTLVTEEDKKEPLSVKIDSDKHENENDTSKEGKEKSENENKSETEDAKLGVDTKEQSTEKTTPEDEKTAETDPITAAPAIKSEVTEKIVENNPPKGKEMPEDNQDKDTGVIEGPVQEKQVDKPVAESKESKSEGGQLKETKFEKNINPGGGQETQSSFVGYLIVLSFITIIAYLIFHNKKKILGLIVEGRSGRQSGRRRSGGKEYRKLDSNVEDMMDSGKETSMRQVIY